LTFILFTIKKFKTFVINFNVYNPSLIKISHTSLALKSTMCGNRENKFIHFLELSDTPHISVK